MNGCLSSLEISQWIGNCVVGEYTQIAVQVPKCSALLLHTAAQAHSSRGIPLPWDQKGNCGTSTPQCRI